MEAEIKLEREQFVSHLNGTTTIEILTLTSLTQISVLLRQCIISMLGITTTYSNHW